MQTTKIVFLGSPGAGVTSIIGRIIGDATVEVNCQSFLSFSLTQNLQRITDQPWDSICISNEIKGAGI